MIFSQLASIETPLKKPPITPGRPRKVREFGGVNATNKLLLPMLMLRCFMSHISPLWIYFGLDLGSLFGSGMPAQR